MLKEEVIVEVEKRTVTGKNAANRLREADLIPSVLYGGGKEMETMLLSVPRKSMLGLLKHGLHDNAIFQLRLKGTTQQRHVMIRDLSVDPVSRKMLHVDFVRILMDRKLRVKVPVEAAGTAEGVKNEGGLLNLVTHELLIECLPGDIPPSIRVDVVGMKLHDSFRVSDLKLGEGIRVLESADRVLVHIGVPKTEEAAAGAVAAPVAGGTQPEVIKKGKKEAEEPAAAGKAAPKAAAPKAEAEKKGKK